MVFNNLDDSSACKGAGEKQSKKITPEINPIHDYHSHILNNGMDRLIINQSVPNQDLNCNLRLL